MLIMKSYEALRYMVKSRGISESELSRRIGRATRHVSNTINNKSDIKSSSMSKYARELGWKLVLVNEETGEEIELD